MPSNLIAYRAVRLPSAEVVKYSLTTRFSASSPSLNMFLRCKLICWIYISFNIAKIPAIWGWLSNLSVNIPLIANRYLIGYFRYFFHAHIIRPASNCTCILRIVYFLLTRIDNNEKYFQFANGRWQNPTLYPVSCSDSMIRSYLEKKIKVHSPARRDHGHLDSFEMDSLGNVVGWVSLCF